MRHLRIREAAREHLSALEDEPAPRAVSGHEPVCQDWDRPAPPRRRNGRAHVALSLATGHWARLPARLIDGRTHPGQCYALAAGVILALGIAAIALHMSWLDLEIFGIAASYANHFYWLYRLFPDGVPGHPFPQFWPSAIIPKGQTQRNEPNVARG